MLANCGKFRKNLPELIFNDFEINAYPTSYLVDPDDKILGIGNLGTVQ